MPTLALSTLTLIGLPTDDARGEPATNPVAGPLAPETVPWSRLTFEGRKLFVSLTSTVTLAHGAASKPEDPFLEPPPAPTGPELRPIDGTQADHRISLETSVLGRRSLELVHFRGADGQAVQRYKRRFGSKSYSKTQRFLNDGVFLRRRSPASPDEAEEGQWTRSNDNHYPLRSNQCRVVADPIELFYFISASPMAEKGDRFSICAFSDKSFARLELEVVDEVTVEPGFKVLRNGRETAPPAAPIRALVARLSATAVDPGSERSFEVMGLEDDIHIHFDPETRLPLEIQGRHSKMGRISIRLTAAELSGAP